MPRSSRMTWDWFESFTHALPSAAAPAIEKCDCCVLFRSQSCGSAKMRKLWLARSNFAIPVWYISPTQIAPSAPSSTSSVPIGEPGRLHRDREVGDVAGQRVKPCQVLLAEMAEPGHAVGVDDDVVRLDFRPGKVVLGDDDLRRPPGRPGKLGDVEGPRVPAVEVDAGEVAGDLVLHPGGQRRPPVVLQQTLRLHVRGAGVIPRHPVEHLEEFRLGMAGVEDALDGVAVRAVQQLPLHVVGARRARQPLRIGELLRAGHRLAQRQVRLPGLAAGQADTTRPVQRVAGGADRKFVLTLPQPSRREPVPALRIAYHADRDGRTQPLRADDHAFHRSVLGGGHLPGQAVGGLCRCGAWHGGEGGEADQGGYGPPGRPGLVGLGHGDPP